MNFLFGPSQLDRVMQLDLRAHGAALPACLQVNASKNVPLSFPPQSENRSSHSLKGKCDWIESVCRVRQLRVAKAKIFLASF